MIDIKRYGEFLLRHNLTRDQFYFIWLILYREYALLYRTVEEGEPFSKREILELVDRGFLINTNKDNKKFSADAFEVTDQFKELIFSKDPSLMFREFWEAYPNFLFIHSKKMPTKGCNMEELEERYINLIKSNVPLHNSIILAIDWAKFRGYLNTGIIKFFESRGWEQLHQEMKESAENGELPSEYQFN
ncbi:hypothetical protein PP178_04135 [Zeaxanthinibacter sp. PT1]|uniref:hypothetical protein n=1 Tax=Zeaxanthinibacter TaxID=561554 RepID=UPI00234BED24|nr:hypothetical protein [Zeaxanthinibacter sp. PT1]MDC6350730.1 hypothetical protein [Zeaxanthinibacter sp. PT1]